MNQPNPDAMIMIIVMPTMVLAMAWAFRALLKYYQNRQTTKLHYELQNNLLDKLGSSPETLEYLHSDAGEKMLALATQERTNPYSRILGALQAGSVLACVSIGFLFLRGLNAEFQQPFSVAGVLGLCLGVGFLVSSALAYFLSSRWGLFDDSSEDES